jgi:AbrB family looped-hinge helix DNA binding protein
MMTQAKRLVRIQEKGQVTLPAAVRRKLNLKKGDLVTVEETDDGVLIRPQTAVPSAGLRRATDTLATRGVSLSALLEGAVMKEHEEFVLPQPTAEDLARRKEAVATIRTVRERMPSLAPLTAADLVRQGREEEGPTYDPGA